MSLGSNIGAECVCDELLALVEKYADRTKEELYDMLLERIRQIRDSASIGWY